MRSAAARAARRRGERRRISPVHQGSVEEGRRYRGGLAGAWGGDEDRGGAVAEGGEEVGEYG